MSIWSSMAIYIYIYIYVYICLSISLSLSLSLSLSIYIYIYISLSLSLSLYIYIYTYRCQSRPWQPSNVKGQFEVRKVGDSRSNAVIRESTSIGLKEIKQRSTEECVKQYKRDNRISNHSGI